MAYELIVIGTSLGGLDALRILLSGLPISFCVPLVIVQHRLSQAPPDGLVEQLQKGSALTVSEPDDKETIHNGHVYVAPADYHLLVERGSFSLSIDAPVLHARPAIDVLFGSAADVYGNACIGIILTGASNDGAAGLALIKMAGGVTIVENPDTARCPLMPQAALSASKIDHVLSVDNIAPLLIRLDQPAPLRKLRAERN